MSDFYKALDELELTDASMTPLAQALRAYDDKLESMYNVIATLVGRMDRLESALTVLLERSAPRNTCVFCTPEAQTDGHGSGRCPHYRDAISRAVQASKLGLCTRCLKTEHQSECGLRELSSPDYPHHQFDRFL
ncbi:unnamed protein product [Nippostrongylus brasiliensis]|uniref:DksA C4-type domain-containing protein n=1 Tax=Nippostrongylus brasiliensis TaxID=27835 RepID=A0A0N4YMN1_NIPBR|nr:unnamed protein product [Nippostrongylus brasiliensis]